MDFGYIRAYSKSETKSTLDMNHVKEMKKMGYQNVILDVYSNRKKISPKLSKINLKLIHCTTRSNFCIYKLNNISNDFNTVVKFLLNLVGYNVRIVILAPFHVVLDSNSKEFKTQLQMLKLFSDFDYSSKTSGRD